MEIRQEISTLRGDPAPQRVAQVALERAASAWRARPDVAEMLADLDAFASCRSLAECAALSRLFDEESAAADTLAGSLASGIGAALRDVPLGHVPFRHHADGIFAMLLLAQSGNVTLSLVAIDGDAMARIPAPATVNYSPCEMWERFLSGTATARLVENRNIAGGDADLRVRDIVLAPGKVVCRDADRQALQVTRAQGCLVSLRLQRRRRNAGLSREFTLTDGTLARQAAGNPRDSRVEMMMALLGRMERADAAPLLARIARGDGSEALRWQALRECLALDTATGFAALCDVAGRGGDPLGTAASALRAQLVAAYPQLAEIEPCPA
jgi:hypothetical protein